MTLKKNCRLVVVLLVATAAVGSCLFEANHVSVRSRTSVVIPNPADVKSPGELATCSRSDQSPAWAVGFGKEFWRRPATASNSLPRTSAAGPQSVSFNLSEVVERVSHAVATNSTSPDPQARARTYTATFDGQGMRFSPHRPGAQQPGAQASPVASAENSQLPIQKQRVANLGTNFVQPNPETEALFRTVSIQRGRELIWAPGGGSPAWSVLGNTAQRLLTPLAGGVVEHCETRSEGTEVAWVLSQPMPGTGPLVVEAELAGLTYAGQTKEGHHFADATGTARVRVGNGSVVDSTGARWEVAMAVEQLERPSPPNPPSLPQGPTGRGGHLGGEGQTSTRLRVQVPAEILAQATYPMAIDPVISPEFGMDNPLYLGTVSFQGAPAVAFNGTNYLVVWRDDRNGDLNRDIYGARMLTNGTVLDPGGIAITTATDDQQAPAVAANGTDFLVVWEDYRSGESLDIYGARVNSAGVVLDPTGLAISATAEEQQAPAVAANGSGYLVVWQDDRNSGSIYAARVLTNGTVNPSAGILISTAALPPYAPAAPAVAAVGTNYLVVWEDYRNFATSGQDIYGARVTGAGVLIETNGILVSTATGAQYAPAVAANGTDYLVAWADSRGGPADDIYGARVSSAGVVAETNGIAISTAATSQTSPAVAANGSDFLVVWQDARSSAVNTDIYGARVAGNGTVLDAGGIPISTAADAQQLPAVTSSGSGYLVSWQDGRNAGSRYDIYGARVSSGGLVSDAGGILISTSVNQQLAPVVAAIGDTYLVVWQDNRNGGSDIYGVRVNGAGAVLDPGGLAISTATNSQYAPAIAANGTNYLVVWQDLRNPGTAGSDIYGARVTSAGVVLETNGLAISTATKNQEAPAVASNGSDYFVVWQDARNFTTNGLDIYAARVTAAGAVLDPSAIPLCTNTNQQQVPAVASVGTNYLVVWVDTRNVIASGDDLYGTRVTSSGVVLETNGFAISTASNDQDAPAVAANGSDYFVVWQDARGGSIDIYGARVSSAGVVMNTNGIAISTAANDQISPAVAANGNDYLVVWQDARNSGANGFDTYGARVSGSGTNLDVAGLAIDAGPQNQQFPAVACSSGQCLVVSQGFRDGTIRTVANFVSPTLAIQSISKNVGGVTLVWVSRPGKSYRVQYKADLAPAIAWTNLVPDIVAGSGTATNIDSTLGTEPQRFYRVAELP